MNYKEFCTELAREVGAIMLKYFRNSGFELKEDMTPVTKADTEINDLVIRRVQEEYPDHNILGEEASFTENNTPYVWVCDPVDGTSPFVHNTPTSVFLLALTKNSESIVGVIYDPYQDRMYFAEKGQGAFLNGEKIKVNKINTLQHAMINISIWKKAPYDLVPLYNKLIEADAYLTDLRCIGYGAMLVASGEYSAAIFPGKTPWDVASLKVIVEEAGGKVTNLDGEEQGYASPIKGASISNGLLHDDLESFLK